MKNLLFTLMLIGLAGMISAQTTFCLSFDNASISPDGQRLEFEIYATGNQDYILGSSNLQFAFDQSALSTPTFVSSPLAPPFYQIPTVTEPNAGEASFNIEQAFETFGTTVTIAPVLLGRVSFSIVDNSLLTNLGWSYNGMTTQTVVFDDVTQIFATTNSETCLQPLQNIALPIKMKSFTAVPFENRDANLNWSTASEVNGSHFEIERSDDGVNFAQIGRVEATGNSSVDQDYKFSDREVNMERASDLVKYYRIKLVDIDGEYKYSGIRVVNFTRSDIDFTVSAFPNPTINYVQLELTGLDNTSEDRPMLNIYSNTGELVRSERLNSDLGKIDMSNLPGSLYHFIIDYKGQRYTEKIVVIK